MTTFHGFDANQAVIAYWGLNSDLLPDHVRNKMADKIAAGGLVQLDGTLEGLYAARATLNSEGLALLADMADFFARMGFMGKAARAGQIQGVALRIEAGGAFEEETDPEIDQEFVEQTVEAPAP